MVTCLNNIVLSQRCNVLFRMLFFFAHVVDALLWYRLYLVTQPQLIGLYVVHGNHLEHNIDRNNNNNNDNNNNNVLTINCDSEWYLRKITCDNSNDMLSN